jgi:hypothetical protein
MKRNCLLILLAMLAYSCSTYQATITKQESLDHGAVRVQPGWQYKTPKGKKAILPLIGGAAGGIYGYQTETIFETDTLAGVENAALWAAGGAVVGGILNGIFFPRRRGRHDFDLSQSDKWIRKYNKASGKKYLITKEETGNTLVLVPRAEALAFRQRYQRLERDLTSAHPTTDFQALQAWEAQLEGEYAVFADEEVRQVKALIERHKEQVATATLLKKAERLHALRDDYPSLQEANVFLADNSTLFQYASAQSQKDVRRAVDTKIHHLLVITVAQEMGDYAALSLPELNALSSRFNAKYREFVSYRPVQEANENIRKTKEQQLLAQIDQVAAAVKSAEHVREVVAMERLYLSLLQESDHPQIAGLAVQMSQRKADIKEEKRRRQEREIRERKLAEERALARYGFRFQTDGLSNPNLIKNFFYGNFADIPYHRDDHAFIALLKHYLYTKAKRCPLTPGSDPVQITEPECKTERVVRNGYGVVIDRYCIEWADRGTGLYTSSTLYRAYNIVINMAKRNALSDFWSTLQDLYKGGMGSLNASAARSSALQSDIEQLFQMNGCHDRALQRFEANLIQFATNKPPITLDGRVERQRADYEEEQDLEQLIKDLVFADSKRWTFQYINNSVRNIRVATTDEYNRPKVITATYQFNGLLGGQTDQVKITFQDGLPDCIYYLNYSSNCETPNREVVADFVAGKYIVED